MPLTSIYIGLVIAANGIVMGILILCVLIAVLFGLLAAIFIVGLIIHIIQERLD